MSQSNFFRVVNIVLLLAVSASCAEVRANESLIDSLMPPSKLTLSGALSHRDDVLAVNSSCRELILFTGSNQFLEPMEGAAKQALITGTTGTALSLGSDRLTLHEGIIVVDTGSFPVKIATKVAGLIVDPQSTVLLRYQPGRSIHIEVLAAPEQQPVRVRFAQSPDSICLESTKAVQLDLSDSAARPESVAANIPEYVHGLPLTVKGPGDRSFLRLKHRISSMVASSGTSPKILNTSSPVRVIAKEGTRLVAATDGVIEIIDGEALVISGAEQIIETSFGKVRLRPDAVAAVRTNAEELRVQCYTDPGSVEVLTDNVRIPLTWGKETVAVHRQLAWTDALPQDGVARRSFEAFRLPHSDCVVSDFAIESTLTAREHLGILRRPASAETRQLRDRLLKTAAALQIVTRSKGCYRLRKS